MQCPRCGFTLYEHHSACPWCGHPITPPAETEPEACRGREPLGPSSLPPPEPAPEPPPPHDPCCETPHVVCHFGGGAEDGWEPSAGFGIGVCQRGPMLALFGAAAVAVVLVAFIAVMAGAPRRAPQAGPPPGPATHSSALPEAPAASSGVLDAEVSVTTDRVRMNELAQAVAAYRHDTGELPPTLDALTRPDAGLAGYCGPYVRQLPGATGGRRFVYDGHTGAVSLINADGTRIDSASMPAAGDGPQRTSSAGLAVANAHLAALSAAISAYQRDHGANPPSLGALCESVDGRGPYLHRLPHPPGGGEYRYTAETATVSWNNLSRTSATLLLDPGKAEFPSRDALSGKGPLGVNLPPLSTRAR